MKARIFLPTFVFFLFAFFCFYSVHLTAQTCNYLSYEAFDYAANTPLHTLQGGSGFKGTWDVQNSNNVVAGYQVANNNNSLTYSTLRTIGRHGSGGKDFLLAGRQLNNEQGGEFATNDLLNDNGNIGKIGKTVYWSVVLQKNNNNDNEVFYSVANSNTTWFVNGIPNVAVGYFGTSNSDVGGQKRWTLRINNQFFTTSVPISIGTATLLVIKTTFAANNTQIDLFINPTALGTNTEPTPTLSRTHNTSLEFKTIGFYLGNSPNEGNVDEIRFATSYRCVIPDNSTPVNLPPVADFTVSPASGAAPLSVSFNASASSDPEGGALTYEWDFGDGSPKPTTPITSHTFNDVGLIPVKLTVKDNQNTLHTLTKEVKVLDANGKFPCQFNIGNLQLATCGQSNGTLTINKGIGDNVVLKNGANMTLTPSSGAIYSNLAVGTYTLQVTGDNGCSDTRTLTMKVDSATCAAWQPQTCAMGIGVGLDGFTYYSNSRHFKDMFKNSSLFFTFNATGSSPFNSERIAEVTLDANGYPIVVPANTSGGLQKIRCMISADGYMETGVNYAVLFDGQGDIGIGGTSFTVVNSNRVDFVGTPDNIWLDINSSTSGNHIRNIRILKTSDIATYNPAQPFQVAFLEKLMPFKALRFMDWQATNHNRQTTWATRNTTTFKTQARDNIGIAYEHIIQLANQTNKDIWVCIPHEADADFVTQMATLFRDNVNPNIKIYVEWSNEVWNFIFAQSQWNIQNGPANLNYGRKIAYQSTKNFRIWKQIFAAQPNRLKCVIGTQAGFTFMSEEILAQADPADYDYISPSWYNGLDASNTGNPVLNSSSTPTNIIQNGRNYYDNHEKPLYLDVYDLAKLYGKGVISYEGGQHFTSLDAILTGNAPPYQQAMWDAQIHPNMKTHYEYLINDTRRMGNELIMAFVLSGARESVYGSWGHLESLEQNVTSQPAPKYSALVESIDPACQMVLAIDENEKDKNCPDCGKIQFTAYPNPARGVLTIAIDEVRTPVKVSMTDILGKRVLQENVNMVGTQTLDIQHLQRGIYFISLENPSGYRFKTLKILVE